MKPDGVLPVLAAIALCVTLAVALTKDARADCIKDVHGDVYCGAGRCLVDGDGKVWCSRHYDGGALRNLKGEVLCGIGRCARDSHGAIYCSTRVSGAVLVDNRGRVRCYGSCAPATKADCESTPADTAG